MAKKMMNDQLVDLTPEEQAAYDAQQIAGASQSAAEKSLAQNAVEIRANILTRMDSVRTARTALANGNIFSSMSANEKLVIDGLLQDDLYLGRLILGLFDATD